MRAGKKMAEPAARLTWDQVVAWRLRRQHLHQRAEAKDMLGVVSDLCGLHAQLLSSAELTLWARLEGLEPGALDRALWEERTLVKTWAMRGTLHLLPSAEFSMWQAALDTRRQYLKPVWLRGFGITRDELEELLAAVSEALGDGNLTREELAGEVARITGSADQGERVRGSWGAFLKPAAYRGQLCFGPALGQNVRFARPDRWLGEISPVDPGEALAEATRRYLSAYGPATREDLARWWGVMPPEAGSMLKAPGDEVAAVDVDGTAMWVLSKDLGDISTSAVSSTVRLLPAFDQYVVGTSRDAVYVLPAAFKDRVYRPQGWLSPVLLVDGRMKGVWRHERKGNRLLVTIAPFQEQPDRVRKAAEAEAEMLAGLLGGTLELRWEPSGALTPVAD